MAALVLKCNVRVVYIYSYSSKYIYIYIVTLAVLDRAAKQPIRKTVQGSGESIRELNC